MRLLLDNTALHRVHVVMSTPSAKQAIAPQDAIAFLHFAMHIMFSDGMLVSSFEIPSIQQTSAEAVSRLKSHGCINLPDGQLLLSSENFSEKHYAEVCHNAASSIQEDLQLLDPTTVSRLERLADFTTKPLGVTFPAMEKWITRSWSLSQRHEVLGTALHRKALGAFDFIVASYDPIYRLVRGLAAKSSGARKQFSLAMLLDAIFRIAINEELSRLRCCTYAPAPQRAKLTHEIDHLFRHALHGRIRAALADGPRESASQLIRRAIAVEQLPLPTLAIHFLGMRRARSPSELLNAARELRDCSNVVLLRNWLRRWQTVYNSSAIEFKEKAVREMTDLKESLGIPDEAVGLYSVLRPQATSVTDRRARCSPALSDFSTPIAKLFARLSRRRVFLAALTRKVTCDRQLGVLICRLVGRPGIPGRSRSVRCAGNCKKRTINPGASAR